MATLLQPGRISPLRPVPASIKAPEYVGRRYPKLGEPDVKDAGTIERMRVAGKLAAAGTGGGRPGRRPRGHHRRTGPGRARVPRQPRRLPEHAGLPGLPEVAVHLAERGDLPRHPGRHGDRGRRHRERGHHRVHRRRARRHQRHVPGRRGRRGVPPARRADLRGDDARRPRGHAGPAAERGRPGHRVLRAPVRLRRGQGLHRARDRDHVPLRPDRPALRRPRDAPRCWSRA